MINVVLAIDFSTSQTHQQWPKFANVPLFIFFCFVALCSKSTAIVMAGRSVHLTTLFPGQA